MIHWNAAQLLPRRLQLGEGGYWDAARQKLLYVDIVAGVVECYDPLSGNIRTWNVGKMVSAVIPTADDQLLLAVQGEIVRMDPISGTCRLICEIEPGIPANRCNDGKCDAHGRLWIGTMDVNAAAHAGALYRIQDGQVSKMLEHISISNGLCWSADNKTLYYIDSYEYAVRAYDFNLETGMLSNKRMVVKMTEQGVLPDGMCIDEEGMLWVAIWGGGCVNRYNPATGAIIGKVKVEAPNVTSCVFGGATMQRLFITTARQGLFDIELEMYPQSGSIFYVDLPVKGLPGHVYGQVKKTSNSHDEMNDHATA
ncbi:SMP-30/gluconolactonase/LRE family protein [Deminuibacter soli]|uniref:SMP-30/gluconolactonase/LRE family protein n=1 Tax=Deminuibacter soli TaxID=2291815 RepID=A0A3E1NG85_9BACT|nr:SMP-30/gluconolactonase/LRE family protein [Deminuibacter soli]RFM26892.1 SMP-30/gluconolactonase/LRE family protein [Deminuibacter soli]